MLLDFGKCQAVQELWRDGTSPANDTGDSIDGLQLPPKISKDSAPVGRVSRTVRVSFKKVMLTSRTRDSSLLIRAIRVIRGSPFSDFFYHE